MRILPEIFDEEDSFLIRVDFFTPRLRFLDIMKLWIPKKVEPGATVLEIAFYVESSGICPLVVPGAPAVSAVLFWLPFRDDKQMTRKEIEWLVADFNSLKKTESKLSTKRTFSSSS
jgi:hypothetical protein